MTTPEHADESWSSWQERLSDDLGRLAPGDWITLTTGARTPAPPATPTRPRSKWRRSRAADPETRPAPPDVFLQARLLEDRLALECIGDTEWEGLTDLTAGQQRALVELGWEQDGAEPTFSITYDPADEPWREAAALLADSLRDVLGAASPSDLDLRRSAQRA